ncbi:MAG: hypothetical protein JO316_03980 [Abitibacteriaceae bacterium]|nr:hypothetical protein [Abditibacteriaceae bacterium]
MPTAGRFLEVLVQHLEKSLAPQGITVTSPERFYQNGKCIGEIDVTLRGKFGSSEIFIGIECRDRPQDGPQSIPWLTQISGKKQLLGPHKMIAVSTTGFTPEAIPIAKKLDIDLRTLKDSSEMDMLWKFHTITLHFIDYHTDVKESYGYVENPSHMPDVPLTFGTPILKQPHSDDLLPLGTLFEPYINEFLKTHDDSQLPDYIELPICINGSFHGIAGGKEVTWTRIEAVYTLEKQLVSAKILLNSYMEPESTEPTLFTGMCSIKTKWRSFKILAVARRESDHEAGIERLNTTFHYLTDDYKPLELSLSQIDVDMRIISPDGVETRVDSIVL